jgi:hypothetical protein
METAIKTYQATAWCDRTFTARFEVEADSPEAALAKAKEQVHDELAEECDSHYRWDTFLITDEYGNRLAGLEPDDISAVAKADLGESARQPNPNKNGLVF